MKKLSFILVLCIIFMLFSTFTVSATPKVGDPIGDVLYSDITAYIDGYAIPTSVIQGKTLVVAEDLANYGFVVTWNGSIKSLDIFINPNKEVKPLSVTKDTVHKPGSFKQKHFYTDIKTYLSGEQVESYAIDGRTLIDFELLKKYGKLIWDGNKRELRLTTKNSITSQPKTQTQTVTYYKDYSKVPDFGAFSDAKLLLTDSGDNYVAFVYDIYSNNIVQKYYDLLVENGFYFSYISNANTLIYTNKIYDISVSVEDFGTVIVITLPFAILPVTINNIKPTYYKDYPSVPDFGAFSGAKIKDTKINDNSILFTYDVYSGDIVQKYLDLLVADGFVYNYTYDFYIKDNYLVSASAEKYGTYIFIGFSSATTNNTPSKSTTTSYAFPLHLYSYDGKTYLGKCVTDKYDSDSIYNEFGKYGSPFQTNSIFNKFGKYGGEFYTTSAFNASAKEPPQIVDNNGKFIAYLTTNESIKPRMTLVELDRLIRDNNQ